MEQRRDRVAPWPFGPRDVCQEVRVAVQAGKAETGPRQHDECNRRNGREQCSAITATRKRP